MTDLEQAIKQATDYASQFEKHGVKVELGFSKLLLTIKTSKVEYIIDFVTRTMVKQVEHEKEYIHFKTIDFYLDHIQINRDWDSVHLWGETSSEIIDYTDFKE